MSVVRVGLLGCGRVAAEAHLPALARVPGVAAVAVADADPEQARRVAERFGIARVHASAAALAADEAVDLVAVCTPPAAHAEGALAALAAGRHVFVEKPLAPALDAAGAIAEAAAATPLVAVSGFNLRVHRQVAEARRLIAQGLLGPLLMVRSHWTTATPMPGRGPAGGVLWELGVHHLDLWRHLTGREPSELRATGDGGAIAVSGRVPGGPVLATTLAAGTSDAHEIELVGERGRLVLTPFRADGPRRHPAGRTAGGAGVRLRAAARDVVTLPRQLRAARAGGDFALSFRAQWRAVAEAVRGSASPHATIEDGRRAVALAVAAERALATGAAVEVGT